MGDGCAHVAIDGAGTGKNDAWHLIAPHGFENIVGNDGFLFEVEPRVVNAPARVGIGREMKHLINPLKVRGDFVEVQKLHSVNLKSGIALVMHKMFTPTGGEIVQNPDLLGGRVGQQRVNQMRTDESGTASDNIG